MCHGFITIMDNRRIFEFGSQSYGPVSGTAIGMSGSIDNVEGEDETVTDSVNAA